MYRRFLQVAIVIIFSILFLACLKEEFGGLGIQVPFGKEKVTTKSPYRIISVFKGGTAELAGLKKDDVIKSINGIELIGKQHDYIVEYMLRGKVGTTVTLEIKRGDNLFVVHVPRGRILLQE